MSELTGENLKKVISVLALIGLLVVGIVVSVTRDSSPSLDFDGSEKHEWILVCIGSQGSELSVNCPELAANLISKFEFFYEVITIGEEKYDSEKLKEEIWECVKEDSLSYVQYLDLQLGVLTQKFAITSYRVLQGDYGFFKNKNIQNFYEFNEFATIEWSGPSNCHDFYSFAARYYEDRE